METSATEQVSPQQANIPATLDYLRILETDSAYIVPQGKTESVQTYRGRIYDTMEILMNTETKPPSMRIETLWPNIEWPRIWKNLCTAPISDSTKSWCKIIHDTVATAACLHAKTTGAFWGTLVLPGTLLYLTFVMHPWYCTIRCTVNLAPCHTPVWPLASAPNAGDRIRT